MRINHEQRQHLLQRYAGKFQVDEESYGTVRDYCDSCDHLPFLSSIQGDLKDFQRPWAVKAALGLCPHGAALLEIGAGEPVVASLLAQLGYRVTVVDPYDGSGKGPTNYQAYCERYPEVTIRREAFSARLSGLLANSFDGVFSISVLEHIVEPALSVVFEGIQFFLKPGGVSFHAIDHVVAGNDVDFHEQNLARIMAHQTKLSHGEVSLALLRHARTQSRFNTDAECYYLSAYGHNLWRGATSYDEFPFRKVISILSSVRRPL